MDTNSEKSIVYIVSDSVGETAELVTKAAASQFDLSKIEDRKSTRLNSSHTS